METGGVVCYAALWIMVELVVTRKWSSFVSAELPTDFAARGALTKHSQYIAHVIVTVAQRENSQPNKANTTKLLRSELSASSQP